LVRFLVFFSPPPHDGAVCSAWTQVNGSDIAPDATNARVDSSGKRWVLIIRSCDGIDQLAWAPDLTAADLGWLAFDEVSRRLPLPSVLLSPDVSVGGYVNFETWLAVADPGVVSASSAIPGLSATASARVLRVEWASGDGSVVSCTPFGSLPPSPGYTGPAPCGHTYRRASVTPDDRFHGSVTLVWASSWSASNGAAGDLGELSSSAPFAYRVREIQTVGVEG
jgi:hypothetical protein